MQSIISEKVYVGVTASRHLSLALARARPQPCGMQPRSSNMIKVHKWIALRDFYQLLKSERDHGSTQIRYITVI